MFCMNIFGSFSLICGMCLSFCPTLDSPAPLTAEVILQRELSSPPLADSLQTKGEVTPLPPLASTTTNTFSPWEASPDDPFLALKPIPARAQSAPITRQAEPLDPQDPTPTPAATARLPQGEDQSAFSWSQSQWIAFNDDFVPFQRQQSCGPGTSTGPVSHDRTQSNPSTSRTQSNPPIDRVQSGRSIRFFSEDLADPYNKMPLSSGVVEDSASCVSEVLSALTEGMVASAASQTNNGNL